MQACPAGKAGLPAAYHWPPLLHVRCTRHLAIVMAVTVQAPHPAARPLINAAALPSAFAAFARWHAEPPLARRFSIGYGTPGAHPPFGAGGRILGRRRSASELDGRG